MMKGFKIVVILCFLSINDYVHAFNNEDVDRALMLCEKIKEKPRKEITKKDLNLKGVDLSCAELPKINLSGADLSKAKLNAAILPGANFGIAILHSIDFFRLGHSGYANLSWTNLRCANLFSANADGTSFFYADLRNAICSNGHFEDADFSYADLRGAKFVSACLTGARFDGACVKNADFRGSCGLTKEQEAYIEANGGFFSYLSKK